MSEAKPDSQRIYLDFNATSPPSLRVAKAVAEALMLAGNPSTPYQEGRAVRALLEEGRQVLASVLGAEALDLVFCSGGTEANHLGLAGLARANRLRDPERLRILVPPTVHASLLAVCQGLVREGFRCESLPVDGFGRVELAGLDELLEGASVAAIGFSLINHELGSMEDAAALSTRSRRHGIYLFCDAVQAFAKIPLDVGRLGVDGLSLSAHKIGGPQGLGALWLAPGPDVHALFGGGKQEGARRPGTQATALVAGFTAAMAEVDSLLAQRGRLEPLWQRLRAGLEEQGALLHSDADPTKSLSSTVSGRFPGVAGDLLVTSLDLMGVAISTGAACSSGMAVASPGLLGIGLDPGQALEAIRVSMGPTTCSSDIEVLLELLPGILERAKRFS